MTDKCNAEVASLGNSAGPSDGLPSFTSYSATSAKSACESLIADDRGTAVRGHNCLAIGFHAALLI